MKDQIRTGFEGYFKVECIKDGKVIDVFEDHNTIMRSARRSMAEIFINRGNIDNNIQFANKFVIGTEGGTISEYIPKTEADGFNKDKPELCLYSEESVKPIQEGQVQLVKFNTVLYKNHYYRYLGESGLITISDDVMLNTTDPKFVSISKPYHYDITFSLNKSSDYIIGTDSNNLATGESRDKRCSVSASLPDESFTDILDKTICQFEFVIPKDEANSQHSASDAGYSGNISLFTEAGLYVNGRLFSMKTFPAKVKDDTTELKVTWKIIF